MRRFAVVLLVAVLGASLLPVILETAGLHPQVNLRPAVEAALPRSGVEHPVTAVLLNIRAYDTLLEVAVLLAAGITGLLLNRADTPAGPAPYSTNTLLHALARWFLPLMVLWALWLLYAGAWRPGGAFQAGAVLAGAGVLLRLTGTAGTRVASHFLIRPGIIAGPGVFLLVAVSGLPAGRAFLAYPADLAGALILLIETGLMISIAVILVTLYSAAPAPGNRNQEGS